MYGYSFLDDCVLLYPVYALLFSDTDLSTTQISSLFVLWSLTGILLEVPSGALADAVSRRLLLWTGPLLTATGFALWVLVPSYGTFALGFVLWGAKGACGSGALEALVYEELARLGAANDYARVMGRARTASLLGVMTATALAGPALATGGYGLVGTASVAACVLTAGAARGLPEHRGGSQADSDADEPGGEGWWGALRAGVAEARGDRAVRAALLLVPAVTAVWGALDEYTPLLVREAGAGDAEVPWWLLLIWVGATAGSLLAGAVRGVGTAGLAGLLAGAGLALAAGTALPPHGLRLPAAITLIALAFCAFQLTTVLADARLQAGVRGPSRATVTSLAGAATDLTTVAVYAAYGLLASRTTHGTTFALFAAPYVVTALALTLPLATSGRRGGSHPCGPCRHDHTAPD
ncbi:MFS transporter [Streptomyces flavofungini]|uniref:MFS transporter n=1 Tax=Streptomyces flavofungini TaxID=68200 RepID=UPI0025AFC140|nr:MFS transporter [Streptomyces flavofungini]WJV51391.1 MFS transporter [Streptomyces flavofungini]